MKFDLTISLGNIISTTFYIVLIVIAWRDMHWRVKNLETWRREHQVNSDSRDNIIRKMDLMMVRLEDAFNILKQQNQERRRFPRS